MSRQRPPTTVWIIGSAALAGAEKQTCRMAVELSRRNIRCEVWFLSGRGPLTDFLDSKNVKWHSLGFTKRDLRKALLAAVRLVRLLLETRPSSVVAMLTESQLLALPICALVSPRTARIAGIRGQLPSLSKGLELLLGGTLRRCHAIVCNADHLADEIQRRFALDQQVIDVIPNGVELPAVCADVATQPPSAIMVASLIGYKGHRYLIEALGLVHSKVKVRCFGDGPERSALFAMATAVGQSHSLVFLPATSTIGEEMRSSQFAIHTSMTEGLSNAVLEEMSFGLPIIAFDIPGMSGLVDTGVNGILVPPGDRVQLADAISEMAEHPEMRVRMGIASRRRAERYSWQACAVSYQQLLKEVEQSRGLSQLRGWTRLGRSGIRSDGSSYD